MKTIESHPNAPEGSVRTLSKWTSVDILNSDAILCRNTAPLISTAFSLLLARRTVQVLGRDIGQGLAALVKKLKADNLQDLEVKLNEYHKSKTEELIKKDKESKIQSITDKVECIRIFARNSTSIDGLLDGIKKMFEDKVNAITLATVHKAKGLEWTNVFILNRHLMPSKFATQPWQLQQEQNLIYVAVTRAKLNLTYINSDNYSARLES